MKAKIVPNVFALNQEQFDKKLQLLEFSKEIHLDFMDGKFTKNCSLSLEDMKKIKHYPNKVFNIHLMAYNPLAYLPQLKKLGIQKVYFHFEVYSSDFKIQYDIRTYKEQGFKVGLVLNPSTPILVAMPFFKYLDSIMLMSVWPGEEGQTFIEEILSKIRELRNQGFNGEISVDGGINSTNAKSIIEHGANSLYIGSYISGNQNPQEVYDKLRKLI